MIINIVYIYENVEMWKR